VETSVAAKTAPQIRQLTRRVHAEHHETTLDAGRVGFTLAIPSGATPDFATSAVKLQWSVRLSFLVKPPPPPPQSPKSASQHPRSHVRSPSGAIPPSAQASPNSHTRSKSFAFGSDSASTVPVATGTHHLTPSTQESTPSNTSLRAVPDLTFNPVLYRPVDEIVYGSSTSMSRSPPTPKASLSVPRSPKGSASSRTSTGSVVLMPAKVETVECSFPIRVYPSDTSFRPATYKFVV
jgi:hypothetical protein